MKLAYPDTLPANVAEMREAILQAARTGELDELRTAIEWNELPPDFGDRDGRDVLEFLKALSGDEDGLAILAILINILELPAAKVPLGPDLENNLIFVWPYLAERSLSALTPPQRVDLLRLMPAKEAEALIKTRRWTWWRLAIGADGTWHAFKKSE